MHTAGADADLLAIEQSYKQRGGAFIIMEDSSGEIVACHATTPIDKGAGLITFRRLYLKRTLRGQKLGKRLMDWAVEWSRDAGFKRIEFWSDTRFTGAHEFFEHYGFTKSGEIREMNDGLLPYSEYFFSMDLVRDSD